MNKKFKKKEENRMEKIKNKKEKRQYIEKRKMIISVNILLPILGTIYLELRIFFKYFSQFVP